MSIVALVHNCIVAFGVFVLLGFPLSEIFMAVILTIVAYSLNDTIVLYDRIRENKRLLPFKTPVGELVNRSINQSITRSINTSSTTALAMLVVTIMALIFNVQSIVTFAFPLTIGLLVGMYTSICIAGPLWVKWQQRQARKAQAR
jgi:preprotein translocase SecF subunit